MRGLLRTLGGTLVFLLVFAALASLIIFASWLFTILVIAAVALGIGWLVGWMIWGQGPPKV